MDVATPTEVHRKPIPAEGEDGLFRQSWYPVCLSSEVPTGSVIGRSFLDGRVVIFRGDNGIARVTSAYCPHVGADLAIGRVVENRVQCAFHYFEYDGSGRCVKTGAGDPPPKNACLFVFPSQERWGIVWAFNGVTPLFELPHLGHEEDEMIWGNYTLPEPLKCDGWVFAANTPDMQHLKAVHGVKFDVDDPHDIIEWDEYGLRYPIKATHQGGVALDWMLGLRGTSFFWRTGTYNGFWCAAVTGFGLPYPGVHTLYGAYLVLRGPGEEERLATMKAVSERTIGEDRPILDTIRYRPGALTAADRSLAKYLAMVRKFPRAHPSAPFIR